MARTPTAELPSTGIDHLRAEDSGALKLETINGFKDAGGKISRVFMEDSGKIVLLHQHANGGFHVYERTHVGKPVEAKTEPKVAAK